MDCRQEMKMSYPTDKDDALTTLIAAVYVAPDICVQLERAVGALYGKT